MGYLTSEPAMAAPSYAQAMREANLTPLRQYGLGIESEGDASSIPDISSTVTFSDTEDSDSHSVSSASRVRRNLASLKTKLKNRYKRNSLSPVPSSPSNAGDADDGMPALSRAPSMYSLSRISFSSRLAQLTSIPLPTASSLSAKISSQTTAHLAARCLSEAGEQIKIWTTKAADVLEDLNAEDDVEWSAAGGSEGVEEVEHAITRFEGLVKVCVICIEELQLRSDVRTLSDETLKMHVDQMEDVVTDWSSIKRALKDIKEQVEVALEWDEIFTGVIGDIAQELSSLGDLIFEMEEERHMTVAGMDTPQQGKQMIEDLAIAVEGKRRDTMQTSTPSRPKGPISRRFSPESSLQLHSATTTQEDTKLLGLFARMQPLRASLDFLPMRLAAFNTRGSALFPDGCQQLDSRREELEDQWKKLETDANALRKELGEDRWLAVFRNAGAQALKMFESVERSQAKLSHAIAVRQHRTDPAGFADLVENFQAKKTHYIPAVGRVLTLIDRGVSDRLSVNGEILRLQSEMKARHAAVQASISGLEQSLARCGYDASGHQLRDSVSTIVSDRSHASSAFDTQHSSPASSVVLRSRNSTINADSPSKYATTRRVSNIGLPPPKARTGEHHGISPRHVSEPYKGRTNELLRDFRQPTNKPRWSLAGGSAPANDFLPLSATEPSPYRKELSPRKYTPSASRLSLLPGSSLRNSQSPEPRATPLTARRMSSRPASALDNHSPHRALLRSRPSLAALPNEAGTPSRLPLRSRTSIAALPPVYDDDVLPAMTPSKSRLPRPSMDRPGSVLSNYGNGDSPVARRFVSDHAPRTQTSSNAVAGRRIVSAANGTGRTSRLGGRDSRAGSRMGERPEWKY